MHKKRILVREEEIYTTIISIFKKQEERIRVLEEKIQMLSYYQNSHNSN